MAQLFVIGGASADTLHLSGQKIKSAGGAGMYTAMAAKRSGVLVSMYSPRPQPLPKQLEQVAGQLTAWLGPKIQLKDLPRFEILYENGKTDYLNYSIDAEKQLTPIALPVDLSHYDLIHVTPLGDSENQLRFIQTCREKGARRISAGTGLMNVTDQPSAVRASFEASDYCFMNAEEAAALYGSIEDVKVVPGKFFFITLGEKGALVIQGNHVTKVPGVPSTVVDPTGAGDSFCGATLAHLISGQHPVIAAQKAMSLAAEMIKFPGPTELLRNAPAPVPNLDNRVIINKDQVKKIAQMISSVTEVTPFNFTGPDLPPIGHPDTVNWFFVATLQQFGFWEVKENKYQKPLIASIAGHERKGSDYLWRAYIQMLEAEPDFFTPEKQAELMIEDMEELFRADDGTQPMPAVELHLDQAKQYGMDMLAQNLTPHKILVQSQDSSAPLQDFFVILDHVGGYKEDSLRKKSGLLAFILNQRPEKFFEFGSQEEVTPVIDYHAMRSCLRMGLVNIQDRMLREKIVNRQLIPPAYEQAIRYPCYEAIRQVARLSGKSMGAVDWFFFNSRKRCPEMTEPDCHQCQVDPICAHDKEMFQPVMRTTFY